MDAQTRRAGIVLFSTAIIGFLREYERRLRTRHIHRRYWVHPYLSARAQSGRFFRDVSIVFGFLPQ